jgi:Raf kinase inhibitor-like YbhB/YbcL family protein
MAKEGNNALAVSSPAFENDGDIPNKYTCDGDEINPPLRIDNIPEEAKSLALIVEDPDAPKGVFDHWLVWNIEPTGDIAEDSVPGTVGANSFGDTAYGGPCPPSGTHRYYFRVFALDTHLNLDAGADKKALEQTMHPQIIAEGVLMGRYKKK